MSSGHPGGHAPVGVVKDVGWVGLGIALAACLLALSAIFGRSMKAAKHPRERLRDDREQLEWLSRQAEPAPGERADTDSDAVIDLRPLDEVPDGDAGHEWGSGQPPRAGREGDGKG
jgi:hypothetical protein